MERIRIERTKTGLPALWESGGGCRNTGEATIIANSQGGPKTPIYIRTRGELSNRHHALFVIEVGDFVIMTEHHREDFNCVVYQITAIADDEATVKKVNQFDQGQWDQSGLTPYEDAVSAAGDKATCYHCRRPHYFKEEVVKRVLTTIG